ncbi:MAG: hypothetical protein KGV44_09815 [Flavobacteriaceae bacterium]|nr:hypothetical protein [Flavobacteriaceae bacterium]
MNAEIKKQNKSKKFHIKYFLHKDNSPIWHTAYSKEEAKVKIEELKKDGYKPFIDNNFKE